VYHYTNLYDAPRLIEASCLDLSALVGDASTAQLMARGLTLHWTNAISSVNRNDAAFTLTTIQPLLNGLLRSLRALMSYKADHLRAGPKWLLYFMYHLQSSASLRYSVRTSRAVYRSRRITLALTILPLLCVAKA
jgi:hypothetical protein